MSYAVGFALLSLLLSGVSDVIFKKYSRDVPFWVWTHLDFVSMVHYSI